MGEKNPARFWTLAGMIVGAACLRLLPHPPNFAPITAMALFGGAYFTRRLWAFALPLGAMALSDLLLELLGGQGFHPTLPVVYATFAAVVVGGRALGSRPSSAKVALASVAASTLFYLTTNLAVWALGGLYPPTVAGLLACYVAALPFYGLSLLGDLSFTALLFGTFELLARRFPALARA